MPASLSHGKICYIEIPALDVERSADFYEKVFGWRIKGRAAAWADFEDSAGQVSGRLARARIAHESPGFLIHIMVEDAEAAVAAALGEGGEIVRPIALRRAPFIARIRDPAGNLIGLYEKVDNRTREEGRR